MTPFVAPKTKSAAASDSALGASIGSRNVAKSAIVAARVTRALPKRATVGPVAGIATIAPKAMAKSESPSVEWLIARRSSTSGMCAAQVPVMTPFAKNTAATARRARWTAVRSPIRFPEELLGRDLERWTFARLFAEDQQRARRGKMPSTPSSTNFAGPASSRHFVNSGRGTVRADKEREGVVTRICLERDVREFFSV